MAEPPQLVMIAGPNGSGKSTLIAALRADPAFRLPVLYINADDLQRQRGIADPAQAQRLATDLRTRALQARGDVMYETVMSHPSKIAELQQAKAAGYHVTVHLVATEDPAVNAERVAMRVAAGGHDVPPERIRARYERTLALAPVAIAHADQAFVFDNTQTGPINRGLALHAALQAGRLDFTVDAPAQWVRRVVSRVNGRAAEQQAFVDSATSLGFALRAAQLDGGITLGSIIAIGQHLVLQYDESTRSGVLHEQALLGGQAEALAVGQSRRVSYREAVATLEPPRQAGHR